MGVERNSSKRGANEMDGCDEHRYIYYVIREVVAFAHINVQIMHKTGYTSIKIILTFRLAALMMMPQGEISVLF